MSNTLSDKEKVSIFRSTCVGFGHTEGKPLSTACFTIITGKDYNLYSYTTIMNMVDELAVTAALGSPLSHCQQYVLSQLIASGVIPALELIAMEEQV